MKRILILLFIIFFLLPVMPLFSAQKSEIIIVIDQSRSIREAMPAIKDYIRDRVFPDVANAGDLIHILSFDGQFYEIGTLPAESEAKAIDSLLDKVQPVGGYTDLTNAVIEMSKYSIANCNSNTKKIVFFMTDGLNEPPAFSPFRDGLKESYFKNAREYYKGKGWTIFVSGIGEKTNAPELAAFLEADYIQLSSKPTPEEFNLAVTEKLEKARKKESIPYLPISIGATLLIAGAGSSVFLLRKKA